jgi:hypothetical protein
MMGDVQEYFNGIMSGISILFPFQVIILLKQALILSPFALTLSNGFTYVEYYLSRMDIDKFRSEPFFLLFQRDRSGVRGHGKGGEAYLGEGYEI